MIIKIWSPEHLQNHAVSLRETLVSIGYPATIEKAFFINDSALYIIFCPQVLTEYGWDITGIKNYIVYHTEHAERFLIGGGNFQIFKNALSVWTHTPETMDVFKKYYPSFDCELVPPGLVIAPKQDTERIYDVTFYGNLNERRQKILDLFENSRIKVNVITKLFGKELLEQLLQSKIVLNLHYAIPAPLELFRIHEGLSMGCHVISENSLTEGFKIDYTSIVHFIDDPYKMILWTKYLLDNEIKPNFDVAKLNNRSYVEEAMKKLKL